MWLFALVFLLREGRLDDLLDFLDFFFNDFLLICLFLPAYFRLLCLDLYDFLNLYDLLIFEDFIKLIEEKKLSFLCK